MEHTFIDGVCVFCLVKKLENTPQPVGGGHPRVFKNLREVPFRECKTVVCPLCGEDTIIGWQGGVSGRCGHGIIDADVFGQPDPDSPSGFCCGAVVGVEWRAPHYLQTVFVKAVDAEGFYKL